MIHCEACDGGYESGGYEVHIENAEHNTGKDRRRALEWSVKEEIGTVAFATLSLIARILDGGEQARESLEFIAEWLGVVDAVTDEFAVAKRVVRTLAGTE